MVGAHENLNNSRDMTTPLSGMACRPWASTPTIKLFTKFEVSVSTHYDDTKGGTKRQNIKNGMLWSN